MDELNRIASDYFNAFEGRRHYPPIKSWYWLGCGATFLLWVWSLWYALLGPGKGETGSLVLVVALEVVFIVTPVGIENYKLRALSNQKPGSASTAEWLDSLRTAHLIKAFRRGPEDFLALAEDSMSLMQIDEQLRVDVGSPLVRAWNRVYDAKQKDRLVVLAVAAFAAFVSLLAIALPPESPTVVEFIASDGFRDYMYFLLIAAAVLFGLWCAMSLAVRSGLKVSSLWVARLAAQRRFTRMKVNYMLIDLVRLHRAGAGTKATEKGLSWLSQARAVQRRPAQRTLRRHRPGAARYRVEAAHEHSVAQRTATT